MTFTVIPTEVLVIPNECEESIPIVISIVISFVISTEGRDLKPPITQILPLRIDSDNQIIFLLSTPFFDFLFPCYRGADVRRFLEIDQLVHVVFFRKSRYHLHLVLIYPPFKIVGYADVHDLVVLVCQ